ncbi:MAG: hypothetical protein HY923_04565 [Elusimicrobia bacterium]|nr:hypothetical protein [Elusimicrobiota bacterium]
MGEGPTDRVVIEAAITKLLGDRHFILQQLQPEDSLAFGSLGTGWGGVYHWCAQSISRAGGSLRSDPLFDTFDLLILHLDGDVANKQYADYGIIDTANDLPCDRPCPPASASTNKLREILLRWGGETDLPPKTVLCTPSKNSETWVLTALFPSDSAVASGNTECFSDPEARLSLQPKKNRIRKSVSDYRNCLRDISNAWPVVRSNLSEAERFSIDFLAAIP